MLVKEKTFRESLKDSILSEFATAWMNELDVDQKTIPALAKNPERLAEINAILPNLPTYHDFRLADATQMPFLQPQSVHLVLTSPPYWTLKKYRDHTRQLGDIEDYQHFLEELNEVWKQCYEALTPGGRMICVVGDVCLPRRRNNGRHTVVPLHASIQEQCRYIGFDNLAPIIWHKIANATLEVSGAGSFLGKPYEPNAVIKNDIEFILMQRKPGGYRSPSNLERVFSVISDENHKIWFNQIWTGLTGASTKNHPAPYPLELARRLIKMFSFAGDVVLDPFSGTGTTAIAAWSSGRNSINTEIDDYYLDMAIRRFEKETPQLLCNHDLQVIR